MYDLYEWMHGVFFIKICLLQIFGAVWEVLSKPKKSRKRNHLTIALPPKEKKQKKQKSQSNPPTSIPQKKCLWKFSKVPPLKTNNGRLVKWTSWMKMYFPIGQMWIFHVSHATLLEGPGNLLVDFCCCYRGHGDQAIQNEMGWQAAQTSC